MARFADGVPCWADAMLPDVEAGKRFYGELFGWTFTEGLKEYGYYTGAFRGSDRGRVAALVPKPDGRMPTVWGIYFASSDAEATSARIRAAGGQVITPPMIVEPFGTMVTAADPSGAVFGVWQPAEHEGFDVTGAPGTYVWTEVYTRDPGRVDAFYEAVFGFSGKQLFDTSQAGGIDFRVYSPRDTTPGPENAVAGRFTMGEGFPAELPAHFLVYFGVEDCDAAADTIRRLGGRVTLGPQDSPFGRWATVADDQGANFAIIDTATTVGEPPT
jgi:predicted enzyme related to lactoylglutathione lyase